MLRLWQLSYPRNLRSADLFSLNILDLSRLDRSSVHPCVTWELIICGLHQTKPPYLPVILFHSTAFVGSYAWIRLKSIQAIVSAVNRSLMPFRSVPLMYLTWDSRTSGHHNLGIEVILLTVLCAFKVIRAILASSFSENHKNYGTRFVFSLACPRVSIQISIQSQTSFEIYIGYIEIYSNSHLSVFDHLFWSKFFFLLCLVPPNISSRAHTRRGTILVWTCRRCTKRSLIN